MPSQDVAHGLVGHLMSQVGQRSHNPVVVGSNPTGTTNVFNRLPRAQRAETGICQMDCQMSGFVNEDKRDLFITLESELALRNTS
jgi:hypothetical protein